MLFATAHVSGPGTISRSPGSSRANATLFASLFVGLYAYARCVKWSIVSFSVMRQRRRQVDEQERRPGDAGDRAAHVHDEAVGHERVDERHRHRRAGARARDAVELHDLAAVAPVPLAAGRVTRNAVRASTSVSPGTTRRYDTSASFAGASSDGVPFVTRGERLA